MCLRQASPLVHLYSPFSPENKACLRGLFIKIGAHGKRKRNAASEQLLAQTCTLEQANKTQPSLRLDTELRTTRQTLSKHLLNNFDFHLKQLHLHFYVQDNKPGACLAKQLKRQIVHIKIPYLTSQTHACLTNSKDLANRFSSYYASLYNLTSSGAASRPFLPDIQRFLENLSLPHCPQNNYKPYHPLSPEELGKGIASLPLQKAPGPDGFNNEYYKQFSKLLTPHLCNSFNNIFTTGILRSYHHNHPQNTDIKLHDKVLATRLSSIVPHLVHMDQVGFVAGRQALNGTCHFINLLQ